MKISVALLLLITGFLFKIPADKNIGKDILQRQTVDTVGYAKGIITQLGNKDVYIIECAERHLKLRTINLPAEYKEAGLHVLFSGNIKLTTPLEDEAGDFFEVTAIQ